MLFYHLKWFSKESKIKFILFNTKKVKNKLTPNSSDSIISYKALQISKRVGTSPSRIRSIWVIYNFFA